MEFPFGKGGNLYVATGENADGANAQNPNNLLDKLLSMNRDGSIPSDNPNYQRYGGRSRAIVALGFRNPFALSVQPDTGLIYASNVSAKYEELERYDSDATPRSVNYGSPKLDGPRGKQAAASDCRDPAYSYDHGSGEGTALCGGDFYAPSAAAADRFPAKYHGSYFFSDYRGWIKYIDPRSPSQRFDFAAKIDRAVNGVATFDDLRLDDPVQAIKLICTSSELKSQTSDSFDVLAKADPPHISPRSGTYGNSAWVQMASIRREPRYATPPMVRRRRGDVTHLRAAVSSDAHQRHQGVCRTAGPFAYETPLAQQKNVDGDVRETFSIAGAKIVALGDLQKSIMHLRMKATEATRRMPPVGSNVVDEAAVDAISQWIQSLPTGNDPGIVSGQTYYVTAKHSQKRLKVPANALNQNGAGLRQWRSRSTASNEDRNQQWRFGEISEGDSTSTASALRTAPRSINTRTPATTTSCGKSRHASRSAES